jgi:uncharacterized protein (TIGR00266 family)
MNIDLLYRPAQSLAKITLASGESLVAESGAMVGMSTNVNMQTQSGGVAAGLKRLFGGESFFRNTFTSQGTGELLLASALCGDMTVLEVGDKQWCVQNSAYIANEPTAEVKTKTGGFKGFFSGAGLFVLETSGQGKILIGAFGALEKVEVNGNMVIDTGHLVAWESGLQYSIGKSGSGWVSSFFSGEGLVCHFQGQGTVWIQSRNSSEYGSLIGRMLPAREA